MPPAPPRSVSLPISEIDDGLMDPLKISLEQELSLMQYIANRCRTKELHYLCVCCRL